MPRRPRFPLPDSPTAEHTHAVLSHAWPINPGWPGSAAAITRSLDRAKGVNSLAQAVYNTVRDAINRDVPDWREFIREGLAALDRVPLDDGADTYAAAYAGHRFVDHWLDAPDPEYGPEELFEEVLEMQGVIRLSRIPGVAIFVGARHRATPAQRRPSV